MAADELRVAATGRALQPRAQWAESGHFVYVDPALKLMIDAVRRYDGYILQSTFALAVQTLRSLSLMSDFDALSILVG